jgi:acyl carrier protein
MDIFGIINNFMVTEVAASMGQKTISPDEDLLEKGILDSMGIMKVIVYIENTFGITVEDVEVIPENFQSLNMMSSFISQKIKAKTHP